MRRACENKLQGLRLPLVDLAHRSTGSEQGAEAPNPRHHRSLPVPQRRALARLTHHRRVAHAVSPALADRPVVVLPGRRNGVADPKRGDIRLRLLGLAVARAQAGLDPELARELGRRRWSRRGGACRRPTRSAEGLRPARAVPGAGRRARVARRWPAQGRGLGRRSRRRRRWLCGLARARPSSAWASAQARAGSELRRLARRTRRR